MPTKAEREAAAAERAEAERQVQADAEGRAAEQQAEADAGGNVQGLNQAERAAASAERTTSDPTVNSVETYGPGTPFEQNSVGVVGTVLPSEGAPGERAPVPEADAAYYSEQTSATSEGAIEGETRGSTGQALQDTPGVPY